MFQCHEVITEFSITFAEKYKQKCSYNSSKKQKAATLNITKRREIKANADPDNEKGG